MLLTPIWYNVRLLSEILSAPVHPLPITIHGTIAQWLEQASYKRQVGSSILPSPTILTMDIDYEEILKEIMKMLNPEDNEDDNEEEKEK